MKKQTKQMTHSTPSPLVQIIDILEARGIEHETYTLYEYLDPDALEELVNSGDASLEIRVTIEGVQLSISQSGVRTLTQSSTVSDS